MLGLQDDVITIVSSTRKNPNFSCRIINSKSKLQSFYSSSTFFLNRYPAHKKILIAPLDWGLGHATRCISIIRCLQKYNCLVTIAASGKVKKLLQAEFPELSFIELPGYNILYTKSKRLLPLKILIQIPKILRIIRFENKWLRRVLSENKFDAIISDNRYGFYSNQCPSIFITHQLLIKAGSAGLEKLLQNINYRYIHRFTQCWVPDFEGALNIAGSLSHPPNQPSIPVKYIGPLARFTRQSSNNNSFKWLVILSGPEPQRSLLEEKIFEVAAKTTDSFMIVRGLPGESATPVSLPNCQVFNHLDTAAMGAAIASCEFVISRCGYTTVMELLALKKKSVCIPTPGQTEQEYLAMHLYQQKWCYSFSQQDDFLKQLPVAEAFDYCLPEIDNRRLEPVIKVFVQSL